LETDIANLEREVGTLSAQYNAACRINAKLNTINGVPQVDEEPEEVSATETPASTSAPASKAIEVKQ